jgi:hypothetical protein
VHVLAGATPAELEGYKERNKQALENPGASVADFFSNQAGSLSVVQGDANLSQIADVEHHIATWFQSGEVPMELMGYGKDLNRDVLGEKKAEYEQTLSQLREWVIAELIVPLLERQWLLAGIYPASLGYQVVWREASKITPEIISTVADAAMKLQVLGLPPEMVWGMLGKYLPGVDAEALIAAVTGQTGQGGQDGKGGQDQAERIVRALGGLKWQ